MESFFYICLGLGAIFCAYRAMLAQRLLSSILYLACVSALTSATLYLLGAQQVAVIELSVGAGLVTVLMVYALSVVGDDARDLLSVVPKPLALGVVTLLAILAVFMVYQPQPAGASLNEASFSLATALWQQRVLDVWIQIVLIFAGVLGVLGLLSEKSLATVPARNKIEHDVQEAGLQAQGNPGEVSL